MADVELDPREGVFKSLYMVGGSLRQTGPFRLEHLGFGVYAFVEQRSGACIPFNSVTKAYR